MCLKNIKDNSFLAIFVLAPLHAFAAPVTDNQCTSYIGFTMPPNSFDSVVEHLPQVSSKDEFETSEAFAKRVAEAEAAAPIPLVVNVAVGPNAFHYDADQRQINVSSWAISTSSINGIFFDLPGYSAEVSPREVFDVASKETDIASRSAQNAFGANVRVITRIENLKGIHQLNTFRGSDWQYFPEDERSNIGYISASPEEAKTLLPNLRLAVQYTPKYPFFRQAQYVDHKPTFTDPVEKIMHAELLIGEINCGFVLDNNDIVLAAFHH